MAPPGNDPGRSPDEKLIEGLRSGDTKALRTAMDRLWGPLVGFASRTLSGYGDAEAMVQEAFVRIWDRRTSLKTTGSVRALLYTVVRNLCLDELRRRERRIRADAESTPPSSPRTPYEDVHGAELKRLAAAAVASLPTKRREVFRLVREEGLSYKEVAEALSLSPQTVANHMSLALADLRATLRPYLPGSEPGQEAQERGGPEEEASPS